MHKNYKIDATSKEIVDEFHDRFNKREKKSYQKKIDKMLHQIDIIQGQRFWKKYIESNTVIGFSNYKGEDVVTILETLEFQDEIFVYFLYRLFLELSEIGPIYFNIQVYSDQIFYSTKNYFDKVLMLHSVEQEGGVAKVIHQLDTAISALNVGLQLHGNTKNITKNLLGYEKRNEYRWNTSENELAHNVKILQLNQKKRVSCPLCKAVKEVNYDNKGYIFQNKNLKVVFNCNHEKSNWIGKKKVSISLKKSDIPAGITSIDFILYNWKYFSKEWLNTNDEKK